MQRLFDATIEHFGQIDVLVNNAGYGLKGAFVETPMDEIRQLFDVNFLAAADVMQKALKVMERQGWGVVINVSSEAGIFPTPYMPIYNASKAARTMLSESLRAVVSQRLVVRKDGAGRVPALEVLIVNKAVSNLMRENKTFQIRSILQTGAAQGMCLLDASLENLVKQGVITREEARRHAEEPKRFGGTEV